MIPGEHAFNPRRARVGVVEDGGGRLTPICVNLEEYDPAAPWKGVRLLKSYRTMGGGVPYAAGRGGGFSAGEVCSLPALEAEAPVDAGAAEVAV